MSPDGKLLAWAGRFGLIHLVSAVSKELIRSLKMNDWCRELRFSRDGGSLYTIGEGGEVYIWDVRSAKPYPLYYLILYRMFCYSSGSGYLSRNLC